MMYYVIYEVMTGTISQITVKRTNITVESGDTWTQISREVHKIDPDAHIISYTPDADEQTSIADYFC